MPPIFAYDDSPRAIRFVRTHRLDPAVPDDLAGSGRAAAFRRMMRVPTLRRALLAYLTFSTVEMGSWVTILVWAHSEGGATTVGLVAVVLTLPAAVLAPFLASGVDRLPRALAPPISYALVALSLGATASAMVLSAPFAVVTMLGVVSTVVIGACRPAHHSLTPCLIESPTDLMAANVVATTAEGVGQFAGPALAGVVMAVATPGISLMVFAALTLVATVLTTGFPPVSPPDPVSASIDGAGLRVGLRRLRQDAPSRAPIAIVGIDGVVEGAVDVLLVVLAIDVLMLGDGGAGYLNAALGVGAIIGGLGSYALVGRRNLSFPLLVTGLLTGAAMLLIAALPRAAVMVAAAGIGFGVIAMITKTMLQRLTPGHLMGRMFGWLEGVQLGGLALGSALAPLAIAWVGATASFGLFGLAVPVAVLLFWRRLAAADREADTPTEAIEALRGVDVISALPPEALEALARGAAIRRAPSGTVLVTEGDIGHEMYVIRDGGVQVSRGRELIATLGPGEIFGEIAVLSDAPRIATVSTVTDTTVLAIGRDAFLSALSTDPATRYGVEVLAASRRRETLG